MNDITYEFQTKNLLQSGDPVVAGLVAGNDYLEAQAVLDELLVMSEADSGPEGLGTVLLTHDLGVVKYIQGDYEGSWPFLGWSLERLTRLRGADDPGTLSATDVLGEATGMAGDHVRARELHARAFAGRERLLGFAHWDTMTSAMNLARTQRALEMHEESCRLFRRVHETASATLGERHERTLECLTCLGLCLLDTGDLRGARDALGRSLAFHAETFGPDHVGSMDAAESLGRTLSALGEHDLALELVMGAVSRAEGRFGKIHMDTLRYRGRLGHSLALARNFAGAEQAFMETADGYFALLGPRHPFTVDAFLGRLRARQHKDGPVSVRAHYERMLESLDSELGPDSAAAVRTAGEYALLLAQIGEFARAAELFRRTVAYHERTLGPAHDTTLLHQKYLRIALRHSGDPMEELAVFGRLLNTVAGKFVAKCPDRVKDSPVRDGREPGGEFR
ncbi:MAG: tetratricopeptide repeat protein [Deltaproteobacteria bacterium]|jgi:tetratricopeptide (TPR) repeat protein|nr:tetratricopeptide repeat protein [Deltaproteobacteria bacterium]